MTFIRKLMTKKIDGIHYYCGYKTIGKSEPDWILEQDSDPGIEDIVGEFGMYQYAVTDNPDFDVQTEPSPDNRPYLIVNQAQQPSQELVEAKLARELIQLIQRTVPYDQLIDAVCELARGNTAPALDIAAKVDEIRAEIARL